MSVQSRSRPPAPTLEAAPPAGVLSEIQGLRAIAVLLVIGFHLWPGLVRGGFVGVDIFFVISGFLITAHLAREADRGSIDVVQFWARRIRRLLPASFLVLGFVAVGTVLYAPIADWAQIFRNIIGSTLYVENWVLANDAIDYWAQAAAAPPTQHYWSLSVEEQFYLIWPIIFLFIAIVVRRRRASLAGAARWVLGAIVIGGFAYSLWFTLASPAVAYFSTFTRVWEFALGGFASFLLGWRPRSHRARFVLSWLGIAIIAVSAATISSSLPFPGWVALFPTLGTALVLIGGSADLRGSFSRISAWRPVMYIGDISYSLYLWHWPLLVMAGWIIGTVSLPVKVVLVVLTFILAALTKRFVEDPARRSKWLASRRSLPTFACAAVASIILVAGSLIAPAAASAASAGQLTSANTFAIDGGACAGARASLDKSCLRATEKAPVPDARVVFQDFDPKIEACFSQDDNSALIDCTFGDSSHPTARVALVGDSHAGAVAPALIRLAEQKHWDLHVYLKPGCPWSDTTRFRTDSNTSAIRNCETWRDKASAAIAEASPKFDFVVTTSYAIVGNMVVAPSGQSPFDASVAGLERTWSAFHEANRAPIIVLRDNPNWDDSPVTCLQNENDPARCTESEQAAFSNKDPQVPAAAASQGVHLLDLTDVYCPQGTCPAVIGGIVAYRDAHHFSRSFALSLAPILGQRIDSIVAAHTP